MQVATEDGPANVVARLIAQELPGARGMEAWRSLLRAHATLMRELDRQLEEQSGLALADYDVLAQLAIADGRLRMTELAGRALISRSGMTRRVARLVDEGLVRRSEADGDGRGVVVELTGDGLTRLSAAVPVHMHGISDYFVSKLADGELTVLEDALAKVTVDCTFG